MTEKNVKLSFESKAMNEIMIKKEVKLLLVE